MRLHEIASTGFDEEKFERDCAFYLKQMGHLAKEVRLYRGTTSERAKVGEKNPWSPRSSSVDTPGHIHKPLNEFFESKFGKPWRNGLFTTGSMDVAETYGEPYVIVPAGKFEWLSNEDFEDIYTLILGMDEEDMEAEETRDAVLHDVSSSKKWKLNKDLPGCVSSRCEVMLWCPDGYYLFDPEEELPKAIS